MICPVCESEFKTETDSLDGYILMEEYGGCKTCGLYFYEYITGMESHHLKPFEKSNEYAALISGYDSPPSKLEKLKYDIQLRLTRWYWKSIMKERKDVEP